MKKYKQGDIVLIKYPYSDKNISKQRPVLIVSKKHNNPLYIVAKITSKIRKNSTVITIDNNDVDKPLPKKSQVVINDLYSVHYSGILKKFGFR